MTLFTKKERERYDRHLILNEVGEEGQLKIKNASVLVIGAGGLGSPALLYLAAAGIGSIGIMDNDVVSESNLQRQILYTTAQIGKLKAECASKRLHSLNPYCKINVYPFRLTNTNAKNIVPQYDIVLDATDNLKSRYLINDVCVEYNKPFVYGSVCEFIGHVALFNYKSDINYRTLFPYSTEIEDFKQPLGILGACPGIVGCIQAAEVIKCIIGKPSLNNKLLKIDTLSMQSEIIEF